MTYQPPVQDLNLRIPNPELADVLNAWKQDILNTINCHAIGTVQEFKQALGPDGNPNGLYTVTCTINYSRTYFIKQLNGEYLPQQVPYPQLLDVPAIIVGGGTTYLQFPIKKGDQCLVLFNDRDLNNWFAGNRAGPVATSRMHSIADGIALVGFQNVVSYDTNHAKLSNGNAEVGVPASASGSQVRIANADTTLYTLLSDLITAIEGITVNPGSFDVGGTPVTGISGTVANTGSLESVRSDLQGLLE